MSPDLESNTSLIEKKKNKIVVFSKWTIMWRNVLLNVLLKCNFST